MQATARLLAALACVLMLQTSASAAAPRAIWTWEPESYAMLENEAEAASTIAFLKAHHIQTVYLYADEYRHRNLIAERPALYRALIKRLGGEGITAYALLGSGFLKTERYVLPQFHGRMLDALQRVLDYNAGSKADERFAGINLDIEPHILDQWDHDKDRLMVYFLDMSQAVMDRKRKSGQRLQIGPAIPFWLDGMSATWHGVRKPVSEHVQDIYDYVALMDYRDHALGRDGIVSHAATELAYGRRIGRTVMIGVETTPNEIAKVSFDHLAEADMERELGLAAQAFASEPAFGGFVIHHLAGYRHWLQRAAPNSP